MIGDEAWFTLGATRTAGPRDGCGGSSGCLYRTQHEGLVLLQSLCQFSVAELGHHRVGNFVQCRKKQKDVLRFQTSCLNINWSDHTEPGHLSKKHRDKCVFFVEKVLFTRRCGHYTN